MNGQIIARKRLVTSTISAFVFIYFTKKAPSPWEKRGKRFWMRKLFKDREEKSLFTILVKDL